VTLEEIQSELDYQGISVFDQVKKLILNEEEKYE
jgi:hypothetical protein